MEVDFYDGRREVGCREWRASISRHARPKLWQLKCERLAFEGRGFAADIPKVRKPMVSMRPQRTDDLFPTCTALHIERGLMISAIGRSQHLPLLTRESVGGRQDRCTSDGG